MVQPAETARPLSAAKGGHGLAGKRIHEPHGSEPETPKVSYLEMRKIIMTLSTAACNTVRGIGQDLESVANDVDDAT